MSDSASASSIAPPAKPANGAAQEMASASTSAPAPVDNSGIDADASKHHVASDLKDKITGQAERLRDKTHPPGGYDETPIPHTDEPGYTVKFTFHSATNLPVADLGGSSSDPFIVATLSADLPSRHKEDPKMVHRTRTVHRSTEPVWEQEWVVANVPASGFHLKCRLYDEDSADHDDRLGNVTYEVAGIGPDWAGLDHARFDIKKRMGSKRAYVLKAASAVFTGSGLTGTLVLSAQVLGQTDPPWGHMYTVGPTAWVRHFSPTIGRLTHTLVNKDEREDEHGGSDSKDDKQTKKYEYASLLQPSSLVFHPTGH